MTAVTFPNVNINGTLPGVINDTDFAGYGYKNNITVNGVTYPLFQGFMVACLLQANLNAAAAGGGGSTVFSAFATSTAAADPGAGNMRFNNATMASVTAIYLSSTDAYANAVASVIAAATASTSPTKALLTVRNQSNANLFATFTISAAVNNTGWWTLTVASVAYSSAAPFTAGAQIALAFARTGDQGAAGSVPGFVIRAARAAAALL
jgi:hypothetical protein